MMDDGILIVCTLTDVADPGDMPCENLIPLKDSNNDPITWYFESRNVGYNRQYEAKGVSERVDMLVRTWRNPNARIGMYVVLQDYEGQENAGGDQYRIDNIQHLTDNDGLKVTDYTLYRLDDLYEVATDES